MALQAFKNLLWVGATTVMRTQYCDANPVPTSQSADDLATAKSVCDQTAHTDNTAETSGRKEIFHLMTHSSFIYQSYGVMTSHIW